MQEEENTIKRQKNTIKIYIFSFLIIYIIYHIIIGQYGVASYFKTSNILKDRKIALNKLNNTLDQQQNKIKRLKTNSIDLDLLDEEIRKNLGYAKKNEIILYSEDLEAFSTKEQLY